MIGVATHPEIKGGHWVHKKSPPSLLKESCFLCHRARVIPCRVGAQCVVVGQLLTFAHLHPSKLYFPLNKDH